MNERLRVVALCLAVLFTAQAEVTVKEGAYHDLVVSFSPNVNATNGEAIVESLENLFTETSAVLQKAIGLRIASVTFQIPSSWDTSTWENKTLVDASVLPEDQRDLVVDDTVDSAFGTLPTTLQYGGCGVPGHRLTVPVGFLDEITEEYVPKGQLLAREWLKFRYGVFDENGFDGDDMYPLYYSIPGTTDARITECTDPEVEYYFRDTDGNNCSLEIPFASLSKCEIHPKEISQNTTSSLMYYHKELTNMMNVCGKEHKHMDSTPNKQNVLCSGQSIWEILEKSGDFNETKSEDLQSQNEIKFSYRQEAKSRVVLAFEDSDNLFAEQDIVMFAIRRFFYSLPDGSEFGLYDFNNQPYELQVLSQLDENRNLGAFTPSFSYDEADICFACALDKAVEALSGKTQVTNQNTIILITGSNSPEINDALFEKYKDVCLKIVIFRSAEDPVVDYDGIISSPGCHSVSKIEKELPFSLIFEQLYKSLQESVTQSPTDIKVSEVEAGVMSYNSSLKFNTLSTAAKYTLWTNRRIELQDINCAKADGNSIQLYSIKKADNIASYTLDPVDALTEVTCKLKYPKAPQAFAQVEMTSKPGEYINGEVWVENPSNGEQMPVVLYAKINYGSYPIQDAKVTAMVIKNGTVRLELLDNGRGDPDITEGDGIYSRYFVDLSDEGEYKVFVTVSDNNGKSQVGRKGQSPCCGSKVKSTSEKAGFYNKTFETSFHAKRKPENGFKPSRVFDLKVSTFDPQNYIILNWTAPGGEADNGNASSYVIRYFTSRDDVKNNFNNGTLLENSLEPKFHGSEETLEIKLDNFERSKHHYVALKSLNILGQGSDLSNVLEFFVPEGTDATKTDDGTTTEPSVTKSLSDKKVIGIFIGVLVLVIVLIVAVYLFVHFFVRKPRHKREAANKAENGGVNRNATSPPISLNSIPADVILKHHNEVVSAKSQHKDPPIFKEENLESVDLADETDGANGSDQRNNAEYSTVQKRQPEPGSHRSLERENALPPKRMTNV